MNGTFAAGDQLMDRRSARETTMGNAMMSTLIAAGVVFAIGYGWFTRLQNRGRRSRAAAGNDGGNGSDGYSGASDGFSLGSWFSSDSSGSSSDSCSSSDSGSSGGDCGGGGDGGGGGGGD
ncbi:hypothetical protein M2189_005124 [Bradyrhizobium japonicum]|nr:hypothetical protein [Bradyrhizobium japonicum]MCS3961921.1 hypothetical protein [Bradyrhizobium japonicum]MCS3994238.1 hypothetical protein [Bradyrhizobium japonicum]